MHEQLPGPGQESLLACGLADSSLTLLARILPEHVAEGVEGRLLRQGRQGTRGSEEEVSRKAQAEEESQLAPKELLQLGCSPSCLATPGRVRKSDSIAGIRSLPRNFRLIFSPTCLT